MFFKFKLVMQQGGNQEKEVPSFLLDEKFCILRFPNNQLHIKKHIIKGQRYEISALLKVGHEKNTLQIFN